MRRLTPWLGIVLLLCILVTPGCKRKKRRPPLHSATQGGLASMIQVADPNANVQLLSGFYAIESNSWRWTARHFSAVLRPPKDAARKGATLVLKLSLPELLIQKLTSMQLSAVVNGMAEPAEEYTKPGDFTYARDVPPSAFHAEDAVRVDFTLDKALPANPADERELGVIVRAIGFEAK